MPAGKHKLHAALFKQQQIFRSHPLSSPFSLSLWVSGCDVLLGLHEVPCYLNETAADTAEAEIQQCTSFSPNVSE